MRALFDIDQIETNGDVATMAPNAMAPLTYHAGRQKFCMSELCRVLDDHGWPIFIPLAASQGHARLKLVDTSLSWAEADRQTWA